MKDKLQCIENEFNKSIVLTLHDLSDFLNVTVRTVQRLLKKCDTIRSYDHNGRYFSFARLAQFNSHGIWEYNSIHFSKFGNLKQTLIAVISNSPMGMDAPQIREVLGVETRSFLSKYSDNSQIRREKIGGRYVYFSANQDSYLAQFSKRENAFIRLSKSELNNTEAIRVLIAAIQHPDFTIEQLSMHLRTEKIIIEPMVIKNFFSSHEIKKKTDLV